MPINNFILGDCATRIAFVYSPDSRTAVKYIYSRAFRAPNIYENYYSDGIVVEAPSKLLKPETMGSNEVILERGLSFWLQVTVDGSYNLLQNLIDQVPDPATGLSHFVNVGRDRGRTLELELEAKRTSGLAARASYTLSDALNEVLNTRLDNSPKQMAKFNGTIPLSRFFFGALETSYISGKEAHQGTRVQPSFLPNATLSTGPALRNREFSVSCYNAFDNARFDPAGPDLIEPEIRQDGRTYLFKLSRRLSFQHASTGYSCLSYLPSLPFDALKVDRSFVKNCHSSPEGRMLVQSLITLAQNIGLRVIVEGVETAEHLAVIRDLGANEVQGYLLGRPTSNPIATVTSCCDREIQAAA
jgi:EAL domain/TonB dependent receptor